jgi:hypothetical protein
LVAGAFVGVAGPAAPAGAAGSGSVSGRVVDDAGAPVPGCTVVLQRDASGDDRSDETSPAGTYGFTDLPRGTYRLSVDCAEGEIVSPPPRVDVGTDADVQVADVVAVRAGTISGTVSTPDGAATGGCIEAYDATGGGSQGSSWIDGDGSYSISLPPGAYRVAAQTCSYDRTVTVARGFLGGGDDIADGPTVTVASGVTLPGRDIVTGSPATITGTVTLASSDPAAYVCVEAYGGSDDVPYTRTNTNQDGAYELRGLSATVHDVRFCGSGGAVSYADEWFDDAESRGGASPIDLSTTAAVVADAVLGVGATISGTVTDDVGAPLPGVCLTALDAQKRTVAWGFSARDGSYNLSGLTTGSYVVFAGATGGDGGCSLPEGLMREYYPDSPTIAGATPVAVTAPGTTTVDVALERNTGTSIAGVVEEPGGSPARDVCVRALSPDGTETTTRSGTDGTYGFSRLEPGDHEVSFETCSWSRVYEREYWDDAPLAGDATPVEVGPSTAEADAQLAYADDAAIFHGIVTTGGGTAPVTDECVTAWVNHSETGSEYYELGSARTATDGSYVLAVVDEDWSDLPDEIVLRFGCDESDLAQEYWPDALTPEAATALPVVLGSDTEADADLLPQSAVRGRIAGTITVAGHAGEGGCAVIEPASGTGSAVTAYADASDQYVSPWLVPGSYLVHTCGQGLVPDWFDGAPSADDATPVTVTAGTTTTGIDLETAVINEVWGSVSGAITMDAYASACVEVVDPDDGRVVETTTIWSGWNTVVPYTTDRFAPGTYAVRVDDCSDGAAKYYGGGTELEDAAPVAVAAGADTAGIDIDLGTARGSITGTVRNAASPAGGICVEATNAITSFTDDTFTDSDGTFDLADLPPGPYTVRYACGTSSFDQGYMVEYFDGSTGTFDRSAASYVEVTAGAASIANTTIDASTTLDGTLASSAGGPAAGTCVRAEHESWAVADPTTTSSGTGTFRLRLRTPGAWRVQLGACRPDGWATSWYQGATSRSEATTLDATVGGDLDISDVVDPAPAGQIDGTLTAEGGAPIANGCVGVGFGDEWYETLTGSDGSYVLAEVPDGTHTVTYDSCNQANLLTTTRDVEVDGGDTVHRDVELLVGGAVEGTVTWADGSGPVGGVCVSVTGSSNGFTYTNSDGTYRVERLRSGAVDVSVSGCQLDGVNAVEERLASVGVNRPATTSGVDAQLTRGATFEGTVSDTDGDPLPGICVSTDGNALYGTTNGTGEYRIQDVPAGSVDVTWGGCDAFYLAEHEEGVTFGAGDTVTRDVTLSLAGRISGTVTGSDHACISVQTAAGGDHVTSTCTTDGSYTLSALRPGSYQVRFEDTPTGRERWWDAKDAETADVLVLAEGDQRTGIDAAFSTGAVIADFDGDGQTDVSVFRPSNGGWYIQGSDPTYLGLSGDVPVPADYDGDGASDRAVFRPSTGAWFVQGSAPTYLGLSGDVPVPGDYDGDGLAEFAVFRPSNGGWYVEGAGVRYLGLAGDVPVPADYDGDGATDLAVFRPGNGAWYVEGEHVAYYGGSGDVPLPGDYDGDGTTDRAVFRPSQGAWYIEDVGTTWFGLGTDTPVPGQYDGDGALDLGVFRPTDGGWYLEGRDPAFFGLTGDIPTPRNPALS